MFGPGANRPVDAALHESAIAPIAVIRCVGRRSNDRTESRGRVQKGELCLLRFFSLTVRLSTLERFDDTKLEAVYSAGYQVEQLGAYRRVH